VFRGCWCACSGGIGARGGERGCSGARVLVLVLVLVLAGRGGGENGGGGEQEYERVGRARGSVWVGPGDTHG
jgi:hypothetical protein